MKVEVTAGRQRKGVASRAEESGCGWMNGIRTAIMRLEEQRSVRIASVLVDEWNGVGVGVQANKRFAQTVSQGTSARAMDNSLGLSCLG